MPLRNIIPSPPHHVNPEQYYIARGGGRTVAVQKLLFSVAIGIVVVGLGRAALSMQLQRLVLQESLHEMDAAPKNTNTNNHVHATSPVENHHRSSDGNGNVDDDDDGDNDEHCIFRNSSLYRSIYVYPSPGDDAYSGSILSSYYNNTNINATASQPSLRWPWQVIDERLRQESANHYSVYSMQAQFSTELLVREILTNPQSCLRVDDPNRASLFYVPYLPSIEFHPGFQGKTVSHQTSKFAQAILDILDITDESNDDSNNDNKYAAWEREFGLTSRYWKRRHGADHILVFSEPLQGLSHPKHKRGHYHYIHTQKQLTPPIVISVELSRSFVEEYPQCAARKNILLPYPIIDGKVFNKALDRQAQEQRNLYFNDTSRSISLPSLVQERNATHGRGAAQWYRAVVHGECVPLRKSIQQDFKCTPSFAAFQRINKKAQRQQQQDRIIRYPTGMRLATFCPCPGGDTPSAKRMFDAVVAGCIPIVLSHDFVWPFSKQLYSNGSNDSGGGGVLSESDFALRWNASDFLLPTHDGRCQKNTGNNDTLQGRLECVSADEIERLRRGMEEARALYSYYKEDESLPSNPLQQGILPNGGAAHALVAALEERANGKQWPACQAELESRRRSFGSKYTEPTRFQC